MREIYYQLKDYYLRQVRMAYVISLWIFLAVAIYFNYQYDFENSILRTQNRAGIYPLLVFAYYSIPYVYAFITYAWFYNAWYIFKLRKFWMPVLVGLAALTLNESFYWHLQWIETHINGSADMNFTYACVQNFASFFLYLLPPLAHWLYFDRKKMPLYGFASKRFKAKPYLLMLCCMFPLLLAASFTNDFKETYPLFNDWGFSLVNQLPNWISVVIFEFCYGLNFVMIEFLFRGFMVLAFIEILGMDSILPMATVYCVYHFGKPMGEAISAFFGATILGVVAYNSRSIYGGILIHIGIAFLMELLAFLQKCNF
jgi:hypothetical protein